MSEKRIIMQDIGISDEQLLNLINSVIFNDTEYDEKDFTGGSVQITSTYNHKITKYTVHLLFGYDERRNSRSYTEEIPEDESFLWHQAIALKIKSMQTLNKTRSIAKLNQRLNGSKVVGRGNKVEVEGRGKQCNELVTTSLRNSINEIINHLNQTAKTNYRSSSKKTQDLIKARLNEGFSVDDFKQVHIIKYAEWAGTDFEKFLRPQTLYSNKFESYLNQKVTNYEKLKAVSAHAGVSALELLRQQGYAQ